MIPINRLNSYFDSLTVPPPSWRKVGDSIYVAEVFGVALNIHVLPNGRFRWAIVSESPGDFASAEEAVADAIAEIQARKGQ